MMSSFLLPSSALSTLHLTLALHRHDHNITLIMGRILPPAQGMYIVYTVRKMSLKILAVSLSITALFHNVRHLRLICFDGE